MRKNIKKYFILSIILIPLLITFSVNYINSQKLRDIEFLSSYSKYSFKELKDIATIIAVVEINDDLSSANSFVLYNDTNHSIEGFWAQRNVSVVKYIKNELNLEKSLSIIEPAAITVDNEFLRTEYYDELKKGQRYLVFLSTDNLTNQLSIISANNGKFNLESKEDNQFGEIFEQASLEFALNSTLY